MRISRRGVTWGAAATGVALLLRAPAAARDDGLFAAPSPAEQARITEEAALFARQYDVPGLGIAFARQGRVLHEQALGFADREAREALTPAHRFRIASITKPFTSATIFRLIEQGRLALGEPVLGAAGVLGDDYGPIPWGSPLAAITVEHLLTHSSGGWPNGEGDPMWRDPALSQAQLIRATLKERPLDHAPGSHYAYSNFGYCLLGRVIEKRSGRPYASFVQESIFAPIGVSDMAIAGNTRAERQHLEVRYYRGVRDDPYGMNVRRMDSHGGWIARPAAVALFASHLERGSSPALLGAQSLDTMTAPSPVNPQYAKGWRVNRAGNWWHTGHLPGTSGILVRAHSGLCWAALLNTEHRGDDIDRDLDQLMWRLARGVPAWRA